MSEFIAALFVPDLESRWRRLEVAWLGALFVIGLAGWAYFFAWGGAPLDFHDWLNINVPRLVFLQNALRDGAWPLHMANAASLHDVTDRFLTLPDVVTTPQTLLLLVMSVPSFVVFDVLLSYSAGFAGLILLRRHFNWSLATFSGVFLLVLFNGHIVAHYSVGHFTWGAYFLFPFVALLVCRFLDGDDSWRSVAVFAWLIFYMVLAGGQHHVTWIFLFLALLMPFCWSRAWWLLAVVTSGGLLSAVRLLPPALEVSAFRAHGLVTDVIGYPSIMHLAESMVALRRETPAFDQALPGNIWFFDRSYYEFNAYVGLVGFAILAVGVYRWWRSALPIYRELIVPVIVMTAFSIASVYRIVRFTQMPLVESERYTARMFSLPLVVVIVIAATEAGGFMQRATTSVWHRVLALAALGAIAIDMAANVRLWRVLISSGLFGNGRFDPMTAAIGQRSDPVYVATVLAGLALTAITAVTLAVLVHRERARGTMNGL
ncbi:MAG TPA: hypothetical protein VM096_09720 [Vicinamibacterales bacterium]|nr:hypothetical protein [Vicinamibacterales bacterium]